MQDLVDILVGWLVIGTRGDPILIGAVCAAIAWFLIIKPWFFSDNPGDEQASAKLEALIAKGAKQFQSGDSESAIETFRKVLEEAPLHPFALQNLGIALVDLGRHDEGVQTLKEAVEASPSEPLVRQNYAHALKVTGHLDIAMEQYRKILEIDPDNERAKHDLAAALETLDVDSACD